jgi:hypothetical protein
VYGEGGDYFLVEFDHDVTVPDGYVEGDYFQCNNGEGWVPGNDLTQWATNSVNPTFSDPDVGAPGALWRLGEDWPGGLDFGGRTFAGPTTGIVEAFPPGFVARPVLHRRP